MAKFTATVPLNMRWFGNEISGAAGATHRIPDALYEEFAAQFPSLPGLTWITQDETTSITATIARFKGQPWHDVRAYGATGDGTTDDTAALQATVTAAAGTAPIFISPGTYLVSGSMAPLSGQVIFGSGWNAVLKRKNAYTGKVIDLGTDKSNIVLSSFVIDGNRLSTAATPTGLIEGLRPNLCRVEGMKIFGAPYSTLSLATAALLFDGGSDNVIRGNYVSACGYGFIIGTTANASYACDRNIIAQNTGENIDLNCIFFTGSLASVASTAVVRQNAAVNNSFRNSGDAAIEFGINNYDFVCVGNSVRGGAGSVTGILARDTVGGVISGNDVQGIRGTNGDGIAVSSQVTSVADITIGPNMSRDNTRNGLRIQSAKRVTVTGGNYAENGKSGIVISATTVAALNGVLSTRNGELGFSIGEAGGPVSDINLVGCIAIDNSSTTTAGFDGFGIVDSGSKNIHLSGCIATDTATAGKKQRNGFNAFQGTAIFLGPGNRFVGNATARISNSVTTNLTIHDISQGTAFPTDPITDEKFYRTDRHTEYFYDGTRWLSTRLYRLPLTISDSLNPQSANGTPLRAAVWDADYDLYLEKLYLYTYVVTTNTGAAYWSYALVRRPTGATISTVNTSAIAANAHVELAATINALLGSTETQVEVSATKTGTPGNAYVMGAVTYRLVG